MNDDPHYDEGLRYENLPNENPPNENLQRPAPGEWAQGAPLRPAARPWRPNRWLLLGRLVLALGALVAVGVAVLPTQAAALNARNPFGHFGGFGGFGPGGKGDHGRGPHGGLTVT